jgi:hypothetical protein
MRNVRAQAITGTLIALLVGCTTARESNPPRTATEQLLISTAADHAAGQVIAPFPPGIKVFVDAQYFEGLDTKFTVGAIRNQLARDGAHLVADRGSADLVVEIRSAAQSIDQNSTLFGIPSIDLPIPLAGALKLPEVALFKKAQQVGRARIALTGYDEKDGSYKFTIRPDDGLSHRTQWTVLIFVSWTTDDLSQ